MTMKRLVLAGAAVFFGLTAIAAVSWWLLLIRRAFAFPTEHAGKMLIFLVVFAVVQLMSLLFVIRLILQARSFLLLGFAWLTLTTSFFVLCANALYFFTPAIGAPVVILVCSTAFLATLIYRNRHSTRQSLQG
jgi:hypothetical protein